MANDIKNSVGQKPTEFKVDVTAKDAKGNVLGKGKAYQFNDTQEGLNAAIKRLKLSGVISRINRQEKTDVRNNLAREKSPLAQLKAKAKTDAAAKAELDALMKKYGITGELKL